MLTNSFLAADAGTPVSNHSATGELRDPWGQPSPPDHFRDVARAITDLRRGGATVVREGGAATAFAVVETLDPTGLTLLRGWSASPLTLVRPLGNGDGSGVPAFATYSVPREMSAPAWRELADPMGPPRIANSPMPDAYAACIMLAKLAGLLPILAAAQIGSEGVARARRSGAIVVDASDIAAMRASGARLERVGEARIPLEDAADGRLVAFRNPESGVQHLAIVIGEPEREGQAGRAPLVRPPLVRLHSECFTGDVLGSLRCDCGPQLRDAMRRMASEGAGIILYLAQEGRGIGLLNKLRSYALQDRGLDTLDANTALGFAPDERDFAVAATMLRSLGVVRARLLTNNPEKLAALAKHGIEVERASLLVAANGLNDGYLATKAARFGHLPA